MADKDVLSFFDKALALEPRFVSVFGKDKEPIFERLFSARRKAIVPAKAPSDDYRIELDTDDAERGAQCVKWRKEIFARPATLAPEDKVGKLLDDFRAEIENIRLPIVDRSLRQP